MSEVLVGVRDHYRATGPNTSDLVGVISETAIGPAPSAQPWFANGERVGYDPNARAIVAAQEAPLKIFLSVEGNLAQAVSFLPGFPDGSFGWAKVRPHLPSPAEMPRLFLDYVGMGDSDKPKDYAYSTAERTDLVEAIWRDLGVQSTTLVAFDFSSLVVLEHLRRRLERWERGKPPGGPDIRGVFIFNGGLFTDGHSHPMGTPTHGTPRRCCAASPSEPGAAWADPSRCSKGCQE
jgi:pimeloyl-ACP methyl ester carboxylesterase